MANTSVLPAGGLTLVVNGSLSPVATHVATSVALSAVHTACILLLIVANVATNGAVFVVFYRRPALLTLSNRLVLNLSLANSLLTVGVLPASLAASVGRRWPLGPVTCVVTGLLMTALFAASVLTLLVIAVDRYFAVLRPLHYSMCVTPRRVGLSLAGVWLAAAAGVVPLAVQPHLVSFSPPQSLCAVRWADAPVYAAAFVAVYFVVPLGAMLAIYVRIFRAAKRTSARARRNSSDVTLLQQVLGCDARRRSSIASLLTVRRGSALGKGLFVVHKDDRKAALTGVVVMSTFVACWLPFFTGVAADASLPLVAVRMPGYARAVAVWVALCGCALNPLVYVFRSEPIKQECRRLFGCLVCGDSGGGGSRQDSLRHSDTPSGVNSVCSSLITPNSSAASLVSAARRTTADTPTADTHANGQTPAVVTFNIQLSPVVE